MWNKPLSNKTVTSCSDGIVYSSWTSSDNVFSYTNSQQKQTLLRFITAFSLGVHTHK